MLRYKKIVAHDFRYDLRRLWTEIAESEEWICKENSVSELIV